MEYKENIALGFVIGLIAGILASYGLLPIVGLIQPELNETPVNATQACFLRVEDISGAGVDIPVRIDQCGQLMYMCDLREDVAWKILNCSPYPAKDKYNRSVCVCYKNENFENIAGKDEIAYGK